MNAGHLDLGKAWAPRPLPSFEILERISNAVTSMAHWQEKIHPAEEDQFFLTEEHKHNFVSSFVWGATIHDLKPRLTDKEIEDRWNSYSSPSAKESALKRRDHEYEEYIISS